MSNNDKHGYGGLCMIVSYSYLSPASLAYINTIQVFLISGIIYIFCQKLDNYQGEDK